MDDSTFEFVVGNKPDELKCGTTRRLKSHLSKRGWRAYRVSTKASETKSSTSTSKNRRGQDPPKARRRKTQITLSFRCVTTLDEPVGDTGIMNGIALEYHRAQPLGPPRIEYQLGGGRVDPFCAYPGQDRPFVPALVDHYIGHMAVDIPELDQPGARGLLRSSWFPLVLSEPACFEVIILLSASNFVSLQHRTGVASQLLQLKANAINFINTSLADSANSDNWLGDGVIGAVAKMASFEAMHGDIKSYLVHMEGLRRMVELRGGLSELGLMGLLRRIIIWIDLNSAFLLKTNRFFPGQHFAVENDTEPNPSAFVAA